MDCEGLETERINHSRTVRRSELYRGGRLLYESSFFFPKSKEMPSLPLLQTRLPWLLVLAHLFLIYTLATDSSLPAFQNLFSLFNTIL